MTATDAVPPHENLLTCLYTDVERSTEMSKHSDAYKAAMAEHDTRLRGLIAASNGQIVGTPTGDCFLATFEAPGDAFVCADAIQRSLRDDPITAPDTEEKGKTWTVAVRIGIYRAQQDVKLNATGQYNDVEINLASRVLKVAGGGQILVHKFAHDTAHNKADFAWEAWPGRRLKDFDTPEDLYELLWEGKDTSRGEPGLRFVPPTFRMQLNRYIEREDEQKRVMDEYQRRVNNNPVRLVTLHGFGGIGKTRLATTCALRLTTVFEDGVYFVSLDGYSESGANRAGNDTPEARAEALRRDEQKYAWTAEQIGRALGTNRPVTSLNELRGVVGNKFCMILLDNYETVACKVVNSFIRDLLLAAPRLRLLVTGRDLVSAKGVEQCLDIAPMTPAQAEALLTDRARMNPEGADWRVPDGERAWLNKIWKYTERQPLGIELVAAYLPQFSLQKIAVGLEQTPLGAFAQLPEDAVFGDASRRHEGLERCLEWSYTLLKPEDRQGFAGLGVFADTFTARTVEAVCGVADADMGLLSRLYRVSLVNRLPDYDPDGSTRYTFLRPTRAYAALKLASPPTNADWPDADTLRRAYVAFYQKLAAENGGIDGRNLNDLTKFRVLTAEWPNIAGAIETAERLADWYAAQSMAANLAAFFQLRGLWAEWLQAAQRAVAAARSSANRQSEGVALNNLGNVYQNLNRWQDAEHCYQQALILAREYGDRVGEGQTLNNLGNVYQNLNRWQDAEHCYQQDLAICREYGDRVGEGMTLGNLALMQEAQGDIPGALAWARQALAALETTQDRYRADTVRSWIAEWEG